MLVKPNEWVSAIFNKKQSPFTNRALRQAFEAALDMEPIMKAAVGAPEFYRLDPSLIFREQVWWSDAGKDVYNRPDRERAKRLMREAIHSRLDTVLELSAVFQAISHKTPDHSEAVDAFLEKRAPRFS